MRFFSDFHKSHACSTHTSTNRHHVMLIDIIVNERNEMEDEKSSSKKWILIDSKEKSDIGVDLVDFSILDFY